MRFNGRARAAFSRVELCVVIVNLILLTLVLIPAFRSPKRLELAPIAAPAGARGPAEPVLKK